MMITVFGFNLFGDVLVDIMDIREGYHQMSLMVVDNVSVEFKTRDGVVEPLRGISFKIDAGEILGLVGESGSGKSVTAQAIMGLLPFLNGRVSSGQICV